jgi:hypothetical protein
MNIIIPITEWLTWIWDGLCTVFEQYPGSQVSIILTIVSLVLGAVSRLLGGLVKTVLGWIALLILAATFIYVCFCFGLNESIIIR